MSMLVNIFKFNKRSNKLSARDMIIQEIKSSAPTSAIIAEPSNNPDGWVYVIRGDFDPNDAVPPQSLLVPGKLIQVAS